VAGIRVPVFLGALSIGPTSLKKGEGLLAVACSWEGVELVRAKVVMR